MDGGVSEWAELVLSEFYTVKKLLQMAFIDGGNQEMN